MGQDDPSIGPYHLPGADVGASITFDSSGHPTQLGFDVPGAAEGSDQATIDLSHHQPDPPVDPGWMPNLHPDPPLDIMQLPPPEGFHWDPITHIPVPNAVHDGGMPSWGDATAPAEPDQSGYGDYPEQSGDTAQT